MANPQHLEILNQGVEAWNQWRKNNRWERPDLSGADLLCAKLIEANLIGVNLYEANLFQSNLFDAKLIGANLIGVNLYEATLIGANLTGANLKRSILYGANLFSADLSGAHLEYADFHSANLSFADFSNATLKGANLIFANLENASFSHAQLCSADLTAIRALATDFRGAKLTGACILDWHINASTDLQDVICDYVFIGYESKDGKRAFKRCPHDPTQTFAPGEFTKRYQIVLETVDLFFNDGIDWKAFLNSLSDLQSEYGNDISIQGIEKKTGGTFLVRLEVPSNIDKGAIERRAKDFYQHQLQLQEAQYRQQLQELTFEHQNEIIALYRQHNTQLQELIEDKVTHQSIFITGDVNNSNFTAGDRNNSSINLQQTTLPLSETVDIASELEALKALLAELRSPDQRKIENAIADAQDELTKSQPNKDEVGQALDRALTYAQKTSNFAESIEKLRPHLEKSAAWLGENWYKFLSLVGLTL